MLRRLPTSPLFPYTTLFRSDFRRAGLAVAPLQERPRQTRPADRRRLRRAERTVIRHERQEQIAGHGGDRKSTRLNSSHLGISYAVFCLKKKNNTHNRQSARR